MYRNIPNALSFLRLLLAPLVLVLPQQMLFPFFCFIAVTDMFDGYLARKLHATSTFGVVLDPFADKIFAFFCAYLFFSEGKILPYQLLFLFSRDVAILFFTGYLFLSKNWENWKIQSFFSGKIATTLQILVFSLLALQMPVPSFLYVALLIFGGTFLFELTRKLQ